MVATITAIFLASAPMAVAGTPIGGIIVKGGKNPGGQMLVLATTDADGRFTVQFSEGGAYRLEFVGPSPKQLAESARAGLQLDDVLRAKADTPADAQRVGGLFKGEYTHTSPASLTRITNGSILVEVPSGGGVISGELRSVATGDKDQPVQKGINEAGRLVQPTTEKGITVNGIK